MTNDWKPKLQPCADCGWLCREVSTRDEHAPDCPHWEGVHAKAPALDLRVVRLEAAVARVIEMFSGNDGGPIEGIDWSGEIGLLRAALEKK